MIQTPPLMKDWSVLPLSIMAVCTLVYVGVWAAIKLGLTRKSRTFADNEELYWDRLREVIKDELREFVKRGRL